jgi:hypothetical protein
MKKAVKSFVNSFTDRLDQALDLARKEMANVEAVPVLDEWDWDHPFQYGGVPYGTSKNVNIELASYKGKPTKKYAHLTIWRLDSGRYEWNLYVL